MKLKFAVCAIFAAAACAHAAKTYNFDDYLTAAGGDGIAAMSKIIAEIKTLKGEPATVELSTREYDFKRAASIPAFITADGLENAVFDGRGASLSIDPYNSFTHLSKCKNVAIKNFTVRYSKKDFTQGEVLSVDAAKGSFVFKVQSGYPLLPSDEFLKKCSRRGWAWGSFFDPDKPQLKSGDDSTHVVFIKELARRGEGVYEVFPKVKKILQSVRAGDRFVMSTFFEHNPKFKNTHIDIRYSGSILLENLTMRGVKGMYGAGHSLGIFGGNNFGKVTVSKCNFTYRDKGDLIAGVIDAIHFKNCAVGPDVLNCRFEGLLDDFINISANPVRIVKDLGGNRYKLNRHTGVIEAGAPLGIYYSNTGKWLEGITVLSIEKGVMTTDKPIPDPVEWYPQDSNMAFTLGETWRNRDMTHVFNLNRVSDNFRISGNYFGHQRARAAVIRARNGVIENNVCDGPVRGFWISNEAGDFHEGPIPANITFRGNTFKNVRRYCVLVSAVNSQKNFVPQLGGVRFEGNEYRLTPSSRDVAIYISNGRDFTFKDETYISSSGEKIDRGQAVKVLGAAAKSK